jgi:hypothetical protein
MEGGAFPMKFEEDPRGASSAACISARSIFAIPSRADRCLQLAGFEDLRKS